MPFDREKADRAVRFIESLPNIKGPDAGKRIRLMDFQRDLVRDVFGTVNADGTRQYRTVYLEIPRKNGKSTLAAAIALYLLFADGEQGAEIYGAANDRDQASIVFDIAAEMVKRTPALKKRAEIVEYKKRIVVPGSASFYRAIPRDAAGSHGFNSHGVVFDELHTQDTPDLHDVLTTSTSARVQPLVVEITTPGYDRTTICWREHERARQVIEGIIEDPTFYAVIYSATEFGENEEDVDWKDEELWKKANPALGTFKSIEYMRAQARKAEADPAFLNTYKRLELGIWTQAASRFIPGERWDACGGPIDERQLAGRRCFGGLDLASTTDVAACIYVFDVAGEVQVVPRFWIPEDTIVRRSRDDGVPYVYWRDQGFVKATPGDWIDHDTIEADILADAKVFEIAEVGYDRWGSDQLIQHLMAEGLEVVPFGQGYKDMSAPTKNLLKLVLAGELRHGGHPVLRWMMDNLMVQTDAAGNVKPSKKDSTEKIDGMVALIMALGRRMVDPGEPTTIYEEEGLFTI